MFCCPLSRVGRNLGTQKEAGCFCVLPAFSSPLSWFAFDCCNKTLTKTNLRAGKVYFVFLYLTLYRQGKPTRRLKPRSARKAACWLSSSGSLKDLSYTDQGHLPRNGTVSVPPTPTVISTQENVPTDVPTALSAGGSSSRGVSSFQVTLVCER